MSLYHDFFAHSPSPLPGLASCAPDTRRVASARDRGRQLAADLVTVSFLTTPPATIARRLGLTRQTVHLWQQPRDRGVALSDLLAGPPAWGRGLLSRALVVLDDAPTPRWSASPQALVARLASRCASAAQVLDRRDLDQLDDEALEQVRKAFADIRQEAAQGERDVMAVLEQRRQHGRAGAR